MSGIQKELREIFERRILEQQGLIKTASPLRKSIRGDTGVKLSEGSPNAVLLQQMSPDELQEKLRPLYCKAGTNPLAIGNHPKIERYLKGQPTYNHGITSVFMDMVGSTKLCRNFPLKEVVTIKNTYLSVATSLVLAFDGHVHRLMGDAVLAFFGGPGIGHMQGTIDALNFAANMMVTSQNIILPHIQRQMGSKSTFGICMGVDYGSDEDVLWSRYGYEGMHEITATSFYVDVAAKLQSDALMDQVMIGDSLVKHLHLGDEFAGVKSKLLANGYVPDPYVEPNFFLDDGSKLDYRKYIFGWEAYHRHFNPGRHLGFRSEEPFVATVRVTLHKNIDGEFVGPYNSCSRTVPKGLWIKFKPELPRVHSLYPIRITYRVENHGPEAAREENNGNHVTYQTVNRFIDTLEECCWEHAGFRGLHYMIISYKTKNNIRLDTSKIGVFVE